jgi:flavin reductase (DIM6/NTAB) family NADH-FMN oxidoreductase RutF
MQMVQAGTHTIFIGAVVGALVQDVPNLVYKQGAYSAL